MRGPIPPTWAPYVQGVLRIVCAFLYMAHGSQKLLGYPPAESAPPMSALFVVAGVLELGGGLLLLLGFWTRPVAFLLSGQMAAAYFMAHFPQGFWPLQNKGELAVVYCFVFLYVATQGSGSWSLDRALGRKS